MTTAPGQLSLPNTPHQLEGRYTQCKKRCEPCTTVITSTGRLVRRIFCCRKAESTPRTPTRAEAIAVRQESSELHKIVGGGIGAGADLARTLNSTAFDVTREAVTGAAAVAVNLAIPVLLAGLPIPASVVDGIAVQANATVGGVVRDGCDKSKNRVDGCINAGEVKSKEVSFGAVDTSRSLADLSRGLVRRMVNPNPQTPG